jgi:hypothetical protein
MLTSAMTASLVGGVSCVLLLLETTDDVRVWGEGLAFEFGVLKPDRSVELSWTSELDVKVGLAKAVAGVLTEFNVVFEELVVPGFEKKDIRVFCSVPLTFFIDAMVTCSRSKEDNP